MTCVIDNVIREKAKEATKETNIQAPILTNTEGLGDVEVTKKKKLVGK